MGRNETVAAGAVAGLTGGISTLVLLYKSDFEDSLMPLRNLIEPILSHTPFEVFLLNREITRIFDWVYRLSRLGLGGVFIYAGAIKLLEPETLAVFIQAYGIVPESMLIPVSIALPVLEVTVGIGLLFDIEGSLSVIAGLLVLFIAILSYGIWMGLDVDCGCFGPEDPEAEAFHGLKVSLYRDLVMLAGIGFMYMWRRYRTIEPLKIMLLINKFYKKRRAEDAYV